MENKSKKYKNYLVILGIFAIISFLIGYISYSAILEQKRAVDDVYEVVANGEPASQQEIVDKYNESVPEGEEKYTKERILQILDEMKKGEIYQMLDQGKDPDVISIISMQYLCMFNGFMIVVVVLTWIEKKFLKGLNNTLRIILNVIAVILLLPTTNYIIPLGAVRITYSNYILHNKIS